MKITRQMLFDKRGWDQIIEKFLQLWPDGIEITEANLMKAIENNLDIDWIMFNFAPYGRYEGYRRICNNLPEFIAHKRACVPFAVKAFKIYKDE